MQLAGEMIEKMSIEKNEKVKCSGCMACISICPKMCIKAIKNTEGFEYPVVDGNKCIECGQCEKVCPNMMQESQGNLLQDTYAAYALNEEIREKSSSGGIFSVLAEEILKEKGVVFGAAMSQNCRTVEHIMIKEVAELSRLRGSKYVQSQIGDTYQSVKEYLETGTKVLFSGTPCQVNGLANYLQKKYENLILVDIICHGVPSPLIWEKYVVEWEKEHRTQITEVNFRYKPLGIWRKYGMQNKTRLRSYYTRRNRNPYMRLFLKDYILRPSCYQCAAKKNKYADLTLGDFWGIEKVAPHMDDGKGVSAVIIRSEKGKNFFRSIEGEVKSEKVLYEAAVQENWAEFRSVQQPRERTALFASVDRLTMKQLIKCYCPISRYEVKMAIKELFR